MSILKSQTKYAPQSINDVVIEDPQNRAFLRGIADRKFTATHLMLYGTSGNGKTSIANIIARELSNDSGLWIKKSIGDFLAITDMHAYLSRTQTTYGLTSDDRCVIVFNELDRYKKDLSQLWQWMDEFEDLLMVIFTTNNATAFDTPVLSRCDKYEFKQISPDAFANRAFQILFDEGLTLSRDDVIYYLKTYTGHACDVRDYMRTIDKIVYLKSVGDLPPVNYGNAKKHHLHLAK